MVKRKLVSKGAKGEGKSIPDPPPSLVRLLQKDKEVLNYFTSLQKNLSNDVKRWKDKAVEYKKQLDELGGSTTKKIKGGKKLRLERDRNKKDTLPPLATVQIENGNELKQQLNPAKVQAKVMDSKVGIDDSSLSGEFKDDESLDSLLKEEVVERNHKTHDVRDTLKLNTQRSLFSDDEDSSASSSGFSELAREMSEQMENYDGPSTILAKRDGDDDIRTKKEIMDLIYEAYECLRYCGVTLVDVSPIERVVKQTTTFEKAKTESINPDTNTTIDYSNNRDQFLFENECVDIGDISEKATNEDANTADIQQNGVQFKLTRRSDEDVIQDIFTCLRALIRAPTLKENIDFECDPVALTWYQPFLSRNLIPACFEVDLRNAPNDVQEDQKINNQHPLVNGIEMIIKSLIIMDTYYVEILAKEEEFEKVLQYSSSDEDTTRCIKEGMLHRNISSLILQSLEGEIVSNWAKAERATRSSIVTPEFDVDDESDDESVINKIFDGVSRFTSKLQNRMFLHLEKICLARIACRVLHHRGDEQRLFRLLVDYLIANVPSPALEDYPRYAPTMSMCILEALIYDEQDHIPFLMDYCMRKFSDRRFENTFCQTILSTHSIWKERMKSSDRKVREWAMIENAAFVRIHEKFNEWFERTDESHNNPVARELLNEVCDKNIPTDIASSCISLHISILFQEDIERTQELCGKIIMMIRDHVGNDKSSFLDHLSFMYTSSFHAAVSLHERMWDSICLKGISVDQVKHLVSHDIYLESHLEEMWNLIQTPQSRATHKVLIILLLRMCMILGDGNRSYKIANWLFDQQNVSLLDKTIYKSLALMSSYPTVRVINLRSRQDRWKQIITQSRHAQLLVVPAVASLLEDTTNSCSFSTLWGEKAFCGIDVDHIDFEKQVTSRLPIGKLVKQYVSSHWRPSDLKAFDSNAPKHDNLVRMSVSERACAFSHISSWIGIKNSLISLNKDEQDKLLPFKICGYAQGPPLLVENEGMDPVPVCVILEDDALLVDQFRDRLEKILLELPRDFHFCSLGYSRPKNAPMIHFSQRLGLPTCLWYLTGYILSLDGAEFLLNSLPCIGPVDSWIGLKIVSNWENDYGHRIGVGKVKAFNDMSLLPKRKQLSDIIKFRAFAVLSPLCSQKVAWRNSTSENTLRWRERDTDITYSGHQ